MSGDAGDVGSARPELASVQDAEPAAPAADLPAAICRLARTALAADAVAFYLAADDGAPRCVCYDGAFEAAASPAAHRFPLPGLPEGQGWLAAAFAPDRPPTADDLRLGELVAGCLALASRPLRTGAEPAGERPSVVAADRERARLFALVERAKREWETTFDSIADGVSILDRELTVIRANWAFARVVGATPREVVGKKCHELVHGTRTPCEGCPALAVLAGKPTAVLVREEPQLGNRWLSISAYPLPGSENQPVGIVHLLRDVSEERRLQAAVVRTERLRALGEMAAGVAHSFGNLLVSIQGWAEVLLAGAEDETVRRPAGAILQAALDGAEAVRRLQDYAHIQQRTTVAPVDVNAVVQDALEFARPRWRPATLRAQIAYTLEVDLQPVPPVLGNAAELREVLLNLIFNAIDAMPAGGRLGIATRAGQGLVTIAVSDSGGGIAPELQRKIFEPFFTTKGTGGTGLGLAIAASIIERHNGHLKVSSTPGAGSCFTVELPAAE